MSVTEDRFRDGTGERYLANGKQRCQAVSKTKLKQLRIKYNDPTLRSEDVWPEAQCSWPCEPGSFACSLHGGKSTNIQRSSVEDLWPIDLRERLDIINSNKEVLLNRDREIGQLVARNSQLYESLDDLVLGIEAYQAVAEARKLLLAGEVIEAGFLLDIALRDARTEREVMAEVRENIKLLDKLTTTVFNIRKDLKLLATIDQVKNLLEGIYKGFEHIAKKYIPDSDRNQAIFEFANLIRELANARHVASLDDGK